MKYTHPSIEYPYPTVGKHIYLYSTSSYKYPCMYIEHPALKFIFTHRVHPATVYPYLLVEYASCKVSTFIYIEYQYPAVEYPHPAVEYPCWVVCSYYPLCVCIYTYLPNHKCVDRQVLALPNCKVFGLITVAGRDERRQTSIAQCQHLVWSSVELLAGFDGIGSESKRGWTGSRMRPWRSISMLSTSCASASAANWNLATVSSYRFDFIHVGHYWIVYYVFK